MTTAQAGYTYTGIRHWSFNARRGMTGKSIMNFVGAMATTGEGSRRLGSSPAFDPCHRRRDRQQVRQPGFLNSYNRVVYDARAGFGFAPGEVPVQIW